MTTNMYPNSTVLKVKGFVILIDINYVNIVQTSDPIINLMPFVLIGLIFIYD